MMNDHTKIRTMRYAAVLSRWLILAALVFTAAAAGGIYVTNHLLAKIYSATAVIEVRALSKTPEQYSGWAFATSQDRAFKAEFETIESPQVLSGVVNGLDLGRVWGQTHLQAGRSADE